MEQLTKQGAAPSVPKGYKQTEVGVIPEDWEVVEFSEIGEAIIGLTYSPSDVNSSGKLVHRSSNIQNNQLAYDDNVYVTCNVPDKLILKKNDILICVRNGSRNLIGKSAIIKGQSVGETFGAFMSVFRTNGYAPLIYQCFISNIVQSQINASLGATINQITNKTLNSFQTPLPPTLTEQKAIATALSEVDELISSLDQLLTKKQAIKQGAMQELLTGKTRLQGFAGSGRFKQTEVGRIPEEWDACHFEDVLDGFSSGMTPYRGTPEFYRGNIPWITSGELNYNVITDTHEKITQDAVVKTSLKILPIGTFLMAITGLEAAGTRGSCGVTGIKATTNQSCMALFPKLGKIDSKYLYHFYVHYGNELAFKFCQGTKQQSYTGKIVKILPINLPPTLTEQKAIATVLSDIDQEIEQLESKKAKYQELKQGMMQELLTGKIRLV